MKRQFRPSPNWLSSQHRNRRVTSNISQVLPSVAKSKIDFSWVPAFSLSISVFAAVLFGAGKAYRQTYLSIFGFDDVTLPWSFQDLVYLGITKQITILIAAPAVAIGALLALTVFIVAAIWLMNRLEERRRKSSAKVASKNSADAKSGDDAILKVMQFLVNSLGAVLLFSVLALFFVANAEALGKTDAKRDLESIAGPKTSNTVKPDLARAIVERIVGNQRVSEEGYVVSCTDRACGLYMPDKGKEASRLVTLEHVVSFRYIQ